MKKDKLPEARYRVTDHSKKISEREELLREFRNSEQSSTRSSAGSACVLLAFFALAAVILYVFLTASYSTSGMLILPREFPAVVITVAVGYVLLCLAILLLGRRASLSRFLKKQRSASTDTSAIRLFKEKIDLPYVVAGADGKIIVANRAFEDAVAGKYSSVGEDIRDICKVALDNIIRTTTAESATDQKIREVHAAAVRAYPAALHHATTTDACLNLLREIDEITVSLGSAESLDPDSPLLRVHKIASSAFREAEKRSELWHLCLGTLESTLSASAHKPSGNDRQLLTHIYELARGTYKTALEKENETLRENARRDFAESLEKIVLIAESDPTAGQLYSAFRLRLDMFSGKDLIPHLRTLLLNIRQQIAQSLPDPTIVTDDKDTLTLQAILKLVDEGIAALRNPRDTDKDDRAFSVSILSRIIRTAESIGANSVSRSIRAIHGIADAGLCALLPERAEEYITLVTHELLTATADRRDVSHTDAEIYRIASDMQEAAQNGNRDDEERFIASFRDAVRRVAEESRFGDGLKGSESERIRSIIEKTVSGSLSFLELRTSGVAALSGLIKYGEETLTFRDITKNDQKLISSSVAKVKALRDELSSLSAPTPAAALSISHKIGKTLSDLLSKFDEKADYANIAAASAGEEERSALARTRIFYSELERIAATAFPLSSAQLLSSFLGRASVALMGYRLYSSLLLKAEDDLPEEREAELSLDDSLPEVSDAEYASRSFLRSAELLLLHIGVLRIYGTRQTLGSLSDLEHAAEAIYEKMAVRRILSLALVTVPINSIAETANEGARDKELYRSAAAYFRESTTHRSRILRIACRTLTEQALSFLAYTERLSLESDEEMAAFAQLRTEVARARAMLLSDTDASTPEDLIALSEDIFKKCAARLDDFSKKECAAGVYHAALTYLSEFFSDLNGRLLRRDFFRTYRDTSAEIVSGLYRAEYTLTAIEEIRTISDSVLTALSDHTASFAGLSLRECCSSDLRTIAGLSGTDVIAELEELADAHAEEALTAKTLWELRKETLRRISRRLDHAEECCAFHDKTLVPHRNEITRLRKAVDEGNLLPHSSAQKNRAAEETSADLRIGARDRIVAELRIMQKDLTEDPLSPESIEYRFAHAVSALLETAEAPLSEFLVKLKPFYELLNHISSETLSYRRNKKRFLLLRTALSEEETISFIPKTGAPLSRQSVYELFSEYLSATLHTVRPVRESCHAMNDIFHIVSNTRESIEDDSSPYFRLFAASSLSRIERLIARSFPGERYARIMPPLCEFIRRSAKNVTIREITPTQESILRLCTLTFREADALYRLGEIASDSIKILSRFSPDAVPSSSDSSRIYNTVTEIRQKIETCAQSVPRKGGSYALFTQLDAEAKKLSQKHPHLEKEKYTGDAYASMLAFLHSVSELASPYLILIDSKESATLRSEVSRIRRNVREVADATSTVGSRATAASALAAIGQYTYTFDGEEEIAAIAENASDALSSIPESLGATERIYTIAASALSRIISESDHEEIRTYATKAHTDLAERRTIYHFLVTVPMEELNEAFHDPTDEKIYPAAETLYRKLEVSASRFRIELVTGMLRDSLETLRTLTAPGTFSRIRSVCTVLYRSVEELESALRGLPMSEEETFVPPVLHAKVKQIRDRLDQLFSLAKAAAGEYRKDPECEKIAERITLIICQGLLNIDAITSNKESDSIDRLPMACREILDETMSSLRSLEKAEEHLSDIRSRVNALLPALSFPSPLDDAAEEEDCTAAFSAILRRVQREMEYIPESILRFREESPDDRAAGSLTLYRCEAVARSLTLFLSEYKEHPEAFTTDSLCCAVAGHLAYRASRNGSTDENSVIAVYDRKGRPSGQNNTAPVSKKRGKELFRPVIQNVEETYRLHGLSVSKASVTSSECVTIGGARYIARSYPHRSGGRDYYLVTFTSVEETLTLKQSCEDENTVVALISLDNLEELAQYVRIDHREAEKEVEKALRTWAGEIHGIFHEYERDKYILFFSQKEMASLVNSKFSDILTTLESIKLGDSSVSVTVSMGISALGDTLTMKEQNAALALDMALKRGGAQIAIFRDAENQEDRYEFISGNRVKGLQKEGRAGARVVAKYLCELIRKSGNVLVMGHNFPDFDSIGSCVGIAALARYYKKEVHIVVNRYTQNFRDCTPDLLTLPEYQNVFIDGTMGMELKGTDTLLVLCDVSNTNIMESRDIARTSFNTVIIDHHFKTTDSDDLKTLLTYIDPSASSASELVSEILEEVLPPDALRKEEANVLLSGIMVDTKNFTRSVGARTFAAALYLRQMGANVEISSTYFYEQSGDYKIEVIFRKNLDFHRSHREVAITFCSTDDLSANPELSVCDLRVAASKAADKLLTVRGIRASFALYPYVAGGKEGIAVSGRSDGSINVQQILESFHGGGHFDSAGATLPGKTVSEVITALGHVIDDYFREEEEKAAGDILN